jgi:hypothetical protein
MRKSKKKTIMIEIEMEGVGEERTFFELRNLLHSVTDELTADVFPTPCKFPIYWKEKRVGEVNVI